MILFRNIFQWSGRDQRQQNKPSTLLVLRLRYRVGSALLSDRITFLLFGEMSRVLLPSRNLCCLILVLTLRVLTLGCGLCSLVFSWLPEVDLVLSWLTRRYWTRSEWFNYNYRLTEQWKIPKGRRRGNISILVNLKIKKFLLRGSRINGQSILGLVGEERFYSRSVSLLNPWPSGQQSGHNSTDVVLQ